MPTAVREQAGQPSIIRPVPREGTGQVSSATWPNDGQLNHWLLPASLFNLAVALA